MTLILGNKMREVPLEETPALRVFVNNAGNDSFDIGYCEDVEHGRYIWTQLAQIKGIELEEFRIIDSLGNTVYTGNYITDEC